MAQFTDKDPPLKLPPLIRRPLPDPSTTIMPTKRLQRMPPAFAVSSVIRFRRFVQKILDSLVPTHFALFERSTGLSQTVLLAVAARFAIADALQKGAMTAEELASLSGTNADVLHRLLRALAATGIFRIDAQGKFHNNRLSRGLLSGGPYAAREWVQYVGSQTNVMAWSDLETSARDGRSAFDRVFGMSVWEWFEQHPDEQRMFAHAMMGITALGAPVVSSVYPFREIRTVCDIGGGRGTLLSEILVSHPHLEGWLYDAEGVVDSARALLAARGVEKRVAFRTGNFFETVPSGADAYLLKNILHDWDDEACLRILRNIRQSANPGGRVLILDLIVPKNSSAGLGPFSDAQMLAACSNGRERALEEFKVLLEKSGFRLGRTWDHPALGVIEGTF